MLENLVIVDCGGHGREAFGITAAVNAVSVRWRVLGFIDDAPSPVNLERVRRLGAPFIGTIDSLGSLPPGTRYVAGIGDPRVRRKVVERITAYGLRAACVVHPAATVAPDVIAGEGLLVFAGAIIMTNVVVGRHVHVNQNATLSHDCVLEDYVLVNPLAAVGGGSHVNTGVLIGTTAAVGPGRCVGENATIGAAASVVHDVGTGVVVKGIPAS